MHTDRPPAVRLLSDHEIVELVRTTREEAVIETIEKVAPFFDALRSAKRETEGRMSAKEVGEVLGCSARQVREYHVPNGLKRYSPGRKAFYLRSDVFDYVRAHPLASPKSAKADE